MKIVEINLILYAIIGLNFLNIEYFWFISQLLLSQKISAAFPKIDFC